MYQQKNGDRSTGGNNTGSDKRSPDRGDGGNESAASNVDMRLSTVLPQKPTDLPLGATLSIPGKITGVVLGIQTEEFSVEGGIGGVFTSRMNLGRGVLMYAIENGIRAVHVLTEKAYDHLRPNFKLPADAAELSEGLLRDVLGQASNKTLKFVFEDVKECCIPVPAYLSDVNQTKEAIRTAITKALSSGPSTKS